MLSAFKNYLNPCFFTFLCHGTIISLVYFRSAKLHIFIIYPKHFDYYLIHPSNDDYLDVTAWHFAISILLITFVFYNLFYTH